MSLFLGDGGLTIFGGVAVADDELATVIECWSGMEALLGFDEGEAFGGICYHSIWILNIKNEKFFRRSEVL